MRLISLFTLLVVLTFSSFSQSHRAFNSAMTVDSVAMGPGYANDIYYSFEDGVVASVSRTNWDIGFHTTVWTATIITNGAAGVSLYTYPKSDTAGWATVDTTGLGTWTVMYDSEDDWEDGAFTRTASGHPDYGWGKYNPITHDVVGDSIYILKGLDGTYRKIWIQRKHSGANTYYLRQANLDGSNDHVVQLDINPYAGKNFVYYDFAADDFVDRDPDTASWDLLFTKYMAIQDNGTPYPVVGVLNNFGVPANAFYHVSPDFTDFQSMPFDSTKSPVGWEWKNFDMGSFTWTVDDSAAFFVNTQKENVYKLVFKTFEGSTTGKIVFEKELMSASGLSEMDPAGTARVFPNPATDMINVEIAKEISGKAVVSLFDLNGRQLNSIAADIRDRKLQIDLSGLSLVNGLHLVRIVTPEGLYLSKFMVYRP